MATTNGGSGDDILNGSNGADTLNGGAGSDSLYGAAGADTLNGGSGDDVLDGGSGSDVLKGDSGDDILIYRLAENSGSTDVYTGGSGIDVVRMMLTTTEWLSDSVQYQIARYCDHLATVQRNAQGEVSNGSARDFTFTFGSSTLTVQMMERLEVYVDGARVSDLDAPIINTLESVLGGQVVEDGDLDSDPATAGSVGGTIKFYDLDTTDTHSVSVVAPSSALGQLTASMTNASTGDGLGQVGWTYVLNDSAAQSLAAGEVRTEVFVVRLTDDEGRTVTQNLTITIRGTNDGPVALADIGTAVEDGPVVAGTVATNDSDVDHGATLTYALNGTVPAGLTFNSDGSYSFDPSHSAYQHLAAGATQSVVANYKVTDEHGAASASNLTITVTGTNDAPVAVVDTNSTAEDGPLVTGTVATNDTDVDDGAILTYALNGSVPAGLTFNSDGSYSFDPSHSAYQHLAAGATQSVVANYTVTDERGASSDAALTITVTGTNDGPVALADTNTAIEDSALVTGSVATNDSDVDDGAILTYALSGVVPAGLTFNSNGSYSFDPSNAAYQSLAAGATQNIVAGYTITDQHGASSTSTLTITLAGTNDAPVNSIPGTVTTNEDTAKVITGLSISDVDAGSNTLSVSLSVAHGVLNVSSAAGVSLTGNGTTTVVLSGALTAINAALAAANAVTFTPARNYNGADTLTMSTTDSGSSTPLIDIDTMAMTITPVNDAPVAANDAVYASRGTSLVTIPISALLANDTDTDGLALTITAVGSASGGVSNLLLNSNGTITFTAGNAASGSFAYTTSDNGSPAGTSTATVDVTILSTNGSATVDLSNATYQASYFDGGSNDDALTGNGSTDTFIGGNGSDTLIGSSGDDVLRGGQDNDTLDGGAGTDMLDLSDATAGITLTLNQGTNGGAAWSTGALPNIGTDSYKNMDGVIGTGFNDSLTGSSGNDIIRGGAGSDILNGGGGLDILDFSEMSTGFTLTLGSGGAGSAAVNGADTYSNMEGIAGGNGNDTLSGNTSDNVLRGGGGNDTLNAGAGADILIGGAGADSLNGGTGSDTFRFFGSEPRSVDTITDFSTLAPAAGGDVLDCSDLLIGAPAVTAANVADYLGIREVSGNSVVSIDRDGAGSTLGFEDFAVLSGVTGLNLASLLANNNIDVTP